MSHRAIKTGYLACSILLVLLVGACSSRKLPTLEPLQQRVGRNPVIVIPGITGSILRNTEQGNVIWGNSHSIFFPKDGGYALALPLDAEARAANPTEATSAIMQFRMLGFVRVDIYASLINTLEANGYRSGDVSTPSADDTLFVLPYDWRRGNVAGAQQLAAFLERLREARGDDPLHVDFICQSNAATIVRYFIKYGGASLEQAEAGAGQRPENVVVDKAILVGAANGGALKTLADLNRGRRYAPLIGRTFRPETLFTFDSLYQALPAYRGDLFFDDEGRSMGVDLFDPANWKRYGWSIYGGKAAERMSRAGREDLFGTPKERDAFLTRALDRARRLQHLLMQDVSDFGNTRYYQIGNLDLPTAERALLIRKEGVWQTLFPGDKQVDRDDVFSTLASAPGDIHATEGSQNWMSPQELQAVTAPSVFVPTHHRKIIVQEESLRWILEFLAE